jgi:acetyl-CoA synthetase
MITPLPGVTTTKPESATVPFPGISVELMDAARVMSPATGAAR